MHAKNAFFSDDFRSSSRAVHEIFQQHSVNCRYRCTHDAAALFFLLCLCLLRSVCACHYATFSLRFSLGAGWQGLLRSHVTCPECTHSSVTFDPYTSLSLPLPVESAVMVRQTRVDTEILPLGSFVRAFHVVVLGFRAVVGFRYRHSTRWGRSRGFSPLYVLYCFGFRVFAGFGCGDLVGWSLVRRTVFLFFLSVSCSLVCLIYIHRYCRHSTSTTSSVLVKF